MPKSPPPPAGPPPLARPLRPLTRTSRVAVAAPASAALDPASAAAGLAALRARGLAVETLRPMSPPALGYLAGDDDARAAELNALLARDDLDAVFCLRGGYGLLRLLDRIDYDAARLHPKLVVGYSDVTALHLALWARAGLPGLSGPMVAPDWPALDAETEAPFWALAGGAAPVEIRGPDGEPLVPMKEGAAEGVLLGGNLTLTAALLGTPYLPDLAGAILFVEEVGEAPYRVDGLLARLRLAGVLEQLGGLVFGAFTGADPPPNRPSLPLDDVLDHYAQFVPGPVARGLVYGHFVRKSTLPVGVRARLEVQGELAALTVLEPLAGADDRVIGPSDH
jgi:muramoyltetrapeptide carboxypeptidase